MVSLAGNPVFDERNGTMRMMFLEAIPAAWKHIYRKQWIMKAIVDERHEIMVMCSVYTQKLSLGDDPRSI